MGSRLALLLLATLVSVPLAHGAKLYKWVDRDGNVSYHDRPPPSDAGYRVEEKRFGAGGSIYDSPAAAAREFPVVLYSAPQCSSCDSARAYLQARGVPFTDKNVQADPEAQQELKQLAGELAVPTITVGDKVMQGFLQSLLEGELDAAGYPEAGAGGQPAQDALDEPDEELEPLEPFEEDAEDSPPPAS